MDRGYRLTCTEIALALTTIAICALATASPRQTVIVDRNTGSLVPRNALEAEKRNYSLLAIQNDVSCLSYIRRALVGINATSIAKCMSK